MHLSRKAAAGAVASAAAALMSTGMGTAHAAYDYYGSFAVADRGDQWSIGYAYNAPDQGRADADAMDECGYSNCVVALRWNNGCAALVDRDGRLYTGLGNNLAAAERNALAASGPDPNPLMVSLGSADPSQASVLISKCTA
ncbi:DUF4189 domain-containing protein [Nocardia sp. CA-151230]|uniref:DUF4189 domain-containing protein n=1 Tax=Nocardia sp. CA-151230 TaxID=3239982 RepID=UPI003D9256F8